jgi:hypothetical protein
MRPLKLSHLQDVSVDRRRLIWIKTQAQHRGSCVVDSAKSFPPLIPRDRSIPSSYRPTVIGVLESRRSEYFLKQSITEGSSVREFLAHDFSPAKDQLARRAKKTGDHVALRSHPQTTRLVIFCHEPTCGERR